MSNAVTRCAAILIGVATLAAGLTGQRASTTFTGSQPQLATAGPRVYLAFGLGNAIGVARSDDAGGTFGSPARLPVSGNLALGTHRGPRLAATASTVLVSAIIGQKGGGADGDVVLFRSNDRGATWAPPLVINDVPGSARDGLQSIAARPSGLAAITWLDLREPGTRIYAAISRDHGATWGQDQLVYAAPSGGVCECCHPSVAIDAAGRIGVMFRNNVGGHRDMYVAWSGSDGRFAPPAKLGEGSWPLNACPMDGGGLAVSADGFAAAWRRDRDVFLTTSRVAERRLGAGRDPAIATSGRHHDIVWTSPTGLLLSRDDRPPVALGPGRFPTVASLDDRTVVAWEDQRAIHVRVFPR